MQFLLVSNSVEALFLRLNPVKPGQLKLEQFSTCEPLIDTPKLKLPLSMSHSINAISSHKCSFVD